jgi:hypothetical protein
MSESGVGEASKECRDDGTGFKSGECGSDAVVNADPEADVVDGVTVWDELIGSGVDARIVINRDKIDEYGSTAGDVDVGQCDVAGGESPGGKRKRWVQSKDFFDNGIDGFRRDFPLVPGPQ